MFFRNKYGLEWHVHPRGRDCHWVKQQGGRDDKWQWVSRTRKDFNGSTDRISAPKVKKKCWEEALGQIVSVSGNHVWWAEEDRPVLTLMGLEHRITVHTTLLIGSIPRSPFFAWLQKMTTLTEDFFGLMDVTISQAHILTLTMWLQINLITSWPSASPATEDLR